MKSLIAACAVAVALPLVGCQKSKEEQVLDAIRNRKGPGLVRLVNLTDTPLEVMWMSRPIDAEIAPGNYQQFRNVAAGDQELELMSGGQSVLKVPLKVEEETLYSIVTFGSGADITYTVVTGEDWFPTSSRNVQVFVFDESGKPAKGEVTLTGGSNKYVLSDSAAEQMLSAGTYAIEGADLDVALGGNVEADHNYSLFVIKRSDGSQDALLLQNTVIDEPVSFGAS